MAEARAVADTSASTGAVSRLTISIPSYSENTGEAGRSLANGLRWTAKRALRRARARRRTRYRGRWYTAEQLSQTRQGVASIPAEIHKSSASKATPVAKQETGKRIKCMTFNISGASSLAWQECRASGQSTRYCACAGDPLEGGGQPRLCFRPLVRGHDRSCHFRLEGRSRSVSSQATWGTRADQRANSSQGKTHACENTSGRKQH